MGSLRRTCPPTSGGLGALPADSAGLIAGAHPGSFVDGSLDPTRELQRDIVRVMRQVRPRRVLTQSPERWWDRIGASHPDHLAAGEATIRALYPAARNPFAFPELLTQEDLEPWTVDEAWLMADERADHTVDITDTFDAKLAALRALPPDRTPRRRPGGKAALVGHEGC